LGEHSSAGPTTQYDYITATGVALYWELSAGGTGGAVTLLDFHEYFTWPDGTPVETVNDRNRYWLPGMWAISDFRDGRRYAELLTSFCGSQPF
jgi:hypothetical protein